MWISDEVNSPNTMNADARVYCELYGNGTGTDTAIYTELQNTSGRNSVAPSGPVYENI